MPIRTTTTHALYEALESGDVPVLVDVRTAMEFRGGHIAAAINHPLGSVPADDLRAHPEVWLICRSGARSAQAATRLSDAGLNVVDVAGGMMAWTSAGLPTASAPSAFPRWAVPLVAALTLGLAPFLPEPHLAEKVRWLATGEGLATIDLFDLVLHGAPWVWLLWSLKPQR